MPLESLKKWWVAVLMLKNRTARDYLMLLVLTGLRSSEARNLQWTDIDFERRQFTVRNTKNGDDHCLPMSFLVERLLQDISQNRRGRYVLPACRGSGCIQTPTKQIALVKEWTGLRFMPHDLRRTFNLIAEEAGVE